jgi:hypothetical protein
MTTNMLPARGRPRRFDPDEAVATAQRLFHAKGYDGVSVADLTRALGITRRFSIGMPLVVQFLSCRSWGLTGRSLTRLRTCWNRLRETMLPTPQPPAVWCWKAPGATIRTRVRPPAAFMLLPRISFETASLSSTR